MFRCEVKTSPPQEFKVDVDNGTFEGYAAAYGNVDSGGDRLLYGSGAHIAQANPVLPVYFGHGWMQNERPIGKSLYFEERREGLFTKAKVFDTPAGAEVLTGMREGVLGALSIGWNPVEKKRVQENGKTVREVAKYDLNEYSVLPNGMSMNDRALITSVKGILRFADPKARVVRGVSGITDVGGDPSWEAIEDEVEEAIQALYTDGSEVDVRDISASAVVFDLYGPMSPMEDETESFQVGYSIDGNGVVTLTGDPVAVDVVVSYVPSDDTATAGKRREDLTDGSIPPRDYGKFRDFVDKADPIGLLLDEATFIHAMAQTLKVEGREEEVGLALRELDGAALLLKGICAVKNIEPDDGDMLALIRQTIQNIHEARNILVS